MSKIIKFFQDRLKRRRDLLLTVENLKKHERLMQHTLLVELEAQVNKLQD